MAPCTCPRAAASVAGARAAALAPPRYYVPKRGQVLKRAFKGLLAWLPLPLPQRGWWLSRRRRGPRRAAAHGRAKVAAAASASRLG